MRRVVGVIGIIMLFWMVGCGGGGSGSSKTATKTIGADGGTIESGDKKVVLTIPAGALDTDTEITIEKRDLSEVPAAFSEEDVAAYYELLPDGLVFNTEAVFSYSLDERPVLSETNITIEYPDILTLENNISENLPVAVKVVEADNAAFAEVPLTHFSPYVISKSKGYWTVKTTLPSEADVMEETVHFYDFNARKMGYSLSWYELKDAGYEVEDFSGAAYQYLGKRYVEPDPLSMTDHVVNLETTHRCTRAGIQSFVATVTATGRLQKDDISLPVYDTISINFSRKINCRSEADASSSSASSVMSDGGGESSLPASSSVSSAISSSSASSAAAQSVSVAAGVYSFGPGLEAVVKFRFREYYEDETQDDPVYPVTMVTQFGTMTIDIGDGGKEVSGYDFSTEPSYWYGGIALTGRLDTKSLILYGGQSAVLANYDTENSEFYPYVSYLSGGGYKNMTDGIKFTADYSEQAAGRDAEIEEGAMLVDNTSDRLIFVEYFEDENGDYFGRNSDKTIMGSTNFPAKTGSMVSAFQLVKDGPIIAVGSGSPGSIHYDSDGTGAGTGTKIGDAGNTPRRIRCLLPVCAVSNYGSNALTILSWDGSAQPSITATQSVGTGPVGIDLKADGDGAKIISTGFADNTYTVTTVDGAGAVTDNVTKSVPNGCTSPAHAVWIEDATNTKAVISCYDGAVAVVDTAE